MSKINKKQGIAAIIIAYILMLYNSDDIYNIFSNYTAEFIINLLMTFAAYILIFTYGSWKVKKNKINETVYYISTMISGIFYLVIIYVTMINPYIFNLNMDKLYMLISNEVTYIFIDSVSIFDYNDIIYKYAGIYAGLLIMTIISAVLSNKEGISGKNDNNKINIDYNAVNQYNFQNIENNNDIYLLAGEQKAGKAASIITGMKAGLIIIICRGMSGILLVIYHEIMYLLYK